MIHELMTPVAEKRREEFAGFAAMQLGAKVTFYAGEKDPDLEGFDLAFLGVKEDRRSVENAGCAQAPDVVREQLYRLSGLDRELKIIDLGNIEPGQQVSDTYFALSTVVYELLRNKILPIIIGGSHDLTYSQYLGYQNFEKLVNLVVVDERFDMKDLEEVVDDQNFLMKVLTHYPNYLFNFSQIGYQSYFAEPRAIETLEKLHFDSYRLGLLQRDMEEVEPIVRDADLLSFDVSAIRQSDAPAVAQPTPNGFYGEDACRITRYAGLSDKLTSIGIFGLCPEHDVRNQTSQLVAQMLWYFLDGFYNRKQDYPIVNEQDYFKYIIDLNEGQQELTFWKSKKSERWWIQIPDPNDAGRKKKSRLLIPCSYGDYQMACNDEIPEKWLRAYQRLS